MKLSAVNKMKFSLFSQRIYFFHLFFLSSSTMWDNCGKSQCFILLLMEWEGIKYIIIHIIYAICLKQNSFYLMMRIFIYVNLLSDLFNEYMLSYTKCIVFLSSVEMLFLHHIIFVLCFIIVVTHFDGFQNVKSNLHSWENSAWQR